MIRCLNCMEIYDEEYEVCPYCGCRKDVQPKVASHLRPGTVLEDRYIIGTAINNGGFGIIYNAWDKELGVRVAVKENYPSSLVNRVPGTSELIVLGADKQKSYDALLQRFLQEARTMAKFSGHPNMVRVYSFFEKNNTAYIVMEYLEGLDLRGYLRQFDDGIMDLDDAIAVISEVSKALAAMHKKKIIHRDISPDNIFLCGDGRIVLTDLGAARLSNEDKEMTRSIVLKPGYAPAEQYRSKSKQGPRTDVYALAATMYRMVTGQVPLDSLDRQMEDAIKAPSEINPKLPEWLDTVILTGMAINAEVRFANTEKFVEALNYQKSVDMPQKRIKKRRITRFASIAAIIAVICIFGYRYMGMYSTISGEGIPDGEISALIPVFKTEDEERWKEFKDSFETKFDGKKIDLELVPSDRYKEKLNKALESGEAPDLFAGDYVSEKNAKYKASTKSVLGEFSTRQLYLYKEEKDFIEKTKQLPIGLNVCVLYENTYLSGKSGESFVDAGGAELTELSSESKLFDSEYTQSSRDCFEKIKQSSKARSRFLAEDLTYYVGAVSEKPEIQKKLGGYSQILAITENGKSAAWFRYGLSVNAESESSDKKIASLAVKYALSEEGQNVLCVRNQGIIPVNKKAYATFMDINESLSFIEPDKLSIQQ